MQQQPRSLKVYRLAVAMAAPVMLLLDARKGAAAVFLTRRLEAPTIALYETGLTTVVGHNWFIPHGSLGCKAIAIVMDIFFDALSLLTAIVLPFTALTLEISRNTEMSFAFTLLNILAIATSQPIPDFALFAALTALVVETHLYFTGAKLMPAIRETRWLDLTKVE